MIITDAAGKNTLVINTSTVPKPFTVEITSNQLFHSGNYCIEIEVQHLMPVRFGKYSSEESAAKDIKAFLKAIKDNEAEFIFAYDDNT